MVFTKEEIAQMNRINNLEASLEDYRAFFRVFGVELQNEDESYKSIYEIFEEASKAYLERLENSKEEDE